MGEVSSSCLSASLPPMRSCQANLLTGVTVTCFCWPSIDAVTVGSGRSACRFSLLESAFAKALVVSSTDDLS